MSEWSAALDINPDDSLALSGWRMASALETESALAYASRTPLQVESLQVQLGKISSLETSGGKPVLKTRKDFDELRAQANASVRQGRYGEAVNTLDRVSAMASAARMDYQKEEAERQKQIIAEKAAQRQKTEKPKMSQAHYMRGLVYYGSGDLAGAEKEWNEAVKLNPGHSKAQRSIERLKRENTGDQK